MFCSVIIFIFRFDGWVCISDKKLLIIIILKLWFGNNIDFF